MRYRGASSSVRAMPGGGPQGTLLIVLLFILQVNYAGSPCPVPTTLPKYIHGPEPDPTTVAETKCCHSVDKTENKKYVDDLTMM